MKKTINNLVLILLGLGFSLIFPTLIAQETSTNGDDCDIIIKIDSIVSRFFLVPRGEEVLSNDTEVNRSYYLRYAEDDLSNPEKSFYVSGYDFGTNPNYYKTKAVINIISYNIQQFNKNDWIVLTDREFDLTNSTSVLNLFKDKFIGENITCYVIPFDNNKDIDSVIPGIEQHNSRYLFILSRSIGFDILQDKLQGLILSKTNLKTGETKRYDSYIKHVSSIATQTTSGNFRAKQVYKCKDGEPRNHYKTELKIRINGYIPEGVKFGYRLKSNFSESLLKGRVKGKGFQDFKIEKPFLIPDVICPSDTIFVHFDKPHGYNISTMEKESEWKNANLDIESPYEYCKDSLEFLFEKVPPFEFFYIDVSGFHNIEKIKDLLKEKIVKKNNDYFIFLSNSSQPLIWNTGDDLDELFTRLSLMRPEPAFYYDEKKFIDPYLDELIDAYDLDRREVHFNFLFSESFLNHSSQKFILDCLSPLEDLERLFDRGLIKVFSYSIVDKPKYQFSENDIDKNKIEYIKL